MFILQETPINVSQAKEHCKNTNNGAFTCFEGMVRADEINGSTVNSLLYLANNAECITEGNKIIAEAKSQFAINDALCIQRIGQLNTGELAIWIGVWSGHRDDAFKACRYIIEEVKQRLLIWKKEFTVDGQAIWAHGDKANITL